jgi:hypothetical protein
MDPLRFALSVVAGEGVSKSRDSVKIGWPITRQPDSRAGQPQGDLAGIPQGSAGKEDAIPGSMPRRRIETRVGVPNAIGVSAVSLETLQISARK